MNKNNKISDVISPSLVVKSAERRGFLSTCKTHTKNPSALRQQIAALPAHFLDVFVTKNEIHAEFIMFFAFFFDF